MPPEPSFPPPCPGPRGPHTYREAGEKSESGARSPAEDLPPRRGGPTRPGSRRPSRPLRQDRPDRAGGRHGARPFPPGRGEVPSREGLPRCRDRGRVRPDRPGKSGRPRALQPPGPPPRRQGLRSRAARPGDPGGDPRLLPRPLAEEAALEAARHRSGVRPGRRARPSPRGAAEGRLGPRRHLRPDRRGPGRRAAPLTGAREPGRRLGHGDELRGQVPGGRAADPEGDLAAKALRNQGAGAFFSFSRRSGRNFRK